VVIDLAQAEVAEAAGVEVLEHTQDPMVAAVAAVAAVPIMFLLEVAPEQPITDLERLLEILETRAFLEVVTHTVVVDPLVELRGGFNLGTNHDKYFNRHKHQYQYNIN
jgi:putative heme iron utilization protein